MLGRIAPKKVAGIDFDPGFGLTSGPNAIKAAGLLAMINDIVSLGLEFAHGVLASESFYWDKNDARRMWTKRFRERTGVAPNMLQAAVYSSVLHYLKAVEKVGATDGIPIAMAMKATPINDMHSNDVHLRPDGRAVRDFHLFEGKGRADWKGPWDDYKLLQTLPGDEVFPASAVLVSGCNEA